MPEGDTIYRTARTLRAVLLGREVTAAESVVPAVRALGPGRLVGQTVSGVESRGKHLLVWFAPSDLALHTHMMMSGSWHTYRPGERWRRPPHLARVVLRTRDAVAVCFNAPVCELLSRSQVERHPRLAALGPDALDPDPDLSEARRRLDASPGEEIGVALGDQHVLAGVGNVYRCEVLFLLRVDPWTRVTDVPPGDRDALLAEAVRLLRSNIDPGRPRRVTTAAPARDGRVYVHGKAGRPCPRCRTPIRSARQGPLARVTYWCPRCQGAGPGRARPPC
jgi:endonuclease-8